MTLATLIRAPRYVIRSRGHGCTTLAETAARTYGWRAFGFAVQRAADCWQEHPHR